ncbi:hypothetical protein ABH944_007058 [Caballeronia udeis]|uniref:Lipoprotein n=1 Tax=Caballeronia udeis TaxID=1232866 RepID=A0ABW8MYL9_9BURK
MKRKRNFSCITLCVISFAASSAHAGWYEITNYAGTIGSVPVHMSLQTYDDINRNEPGQWRVNGSYYYDTTALYLKRTRRKLNCRIGLSKAVLSLNP